MNVRVCDCVYAGGGGRTIKVQWKFGLPHATWTRMSAEAEDMKKTGFNKKTVAQDVLIFKHTLQIQRICQCYPSIT